MSKKKVFDKDGWWEWYQGLDDIEQETYWASLFPDQEELLGSIKQAVKQAREDNHGNH